VYQTEATPAATINPPSDTSAPIGAPVTGSAPPALTPPLGVPATFTGVLGVAELGLTPGGVLAAGVGELVAGAGGVLGAGVP